MFGFWGFLTFLMSNPLFFWSVSLVCNLWGVAEVLYSMKGNETESCIELPSEHCQSGYFASAITYKKVTLMSLSALGLFSLQLYGWVWKTQFCLGIRTPLHKELKKFVLSDRRQSYITNTQENLLVMNSNCFSLAIRANSVEDKCWGEGCKLCWKEKKKK